MCIFDNKWWVLISVLGQCCQTLLETPKYLKTLLPILLLDIIIINLSNTTNYVHYEYASRIMTYYDYPLSFPMQRRNKTRSPNPALPQIMDGHEPQHLFVVLLVMEATRQ